MKKAEVRGKSTKKFGMLFSLMTLLVTVIILSLSMSVISCATDSTKQKLQDAKDRKARSQSELDNKKKDIAEMNEEKSSLQGQLNTLNEQLGEVSNNLEQIEAQIVDKENEIDNTLAELENASQIEEQQYASMKKRVQFIYENYNFMLIDVVFGSGDFSDLLTKNQYIEQISAYDRKKLYEYIHTKETIREKEETLEKEKAQLDDFHAKQQAEQSRVAGLVSQTSGTITQYLNDISDAQVKAEEIEEQIKKQDEDIKILEAKLAEEMRLSKLAAASAWRDISEVSFADGDRYLLANLIYCEAGAEPYEGKVAVGAVVINRVLSSVYPDTVVGVIYQNRQFSPVASGRLALALAEGKATVSCFQAADEAMKGYSNVGNCVYFRTPVPGISGQNIGGHVFY